MGLFLHTALLPRCGEAEARQAVDTCAKLSVGLVPEACRYQESAAGTAVWCNEGCGGYEALALALSANLSGPALLLYIYDDDFWGYYPATLRMSPRQSGGGSPGMPKLSPSASAWSRGPS